MRTKRYLKTLDNIVAGGTQIRTAEKIIAEIQGITIEQFEEYSIKKKKLEIQEFKKDIPYVRTKLRKIDLKLLTPKDNGGIGYSIATRNNPEQIIKQFIKEKKRIIRAVGRLDIDVNIIEESKFLSQQKLLPFKFDKFTKLQHFLEEPED